LLPDQIFCDFKNRKPDPKVQRILVGNLSVPEFPRGLDVPEND
jgi:hypothetical protein